MHFSSHAQNVCRVVLGVLAVLGPFAQSAVSQVVNPAEAQRPPQVKERDERLHSWELPPTVVTAERTSLLREEDRIGPYGQPRWTATRLFPTTRIYVIPPGQFELEHWTRVKVPKRGPSTVQTMYEAEVGLPGRWQLDLYYVTEKSGSEGTVEPVEQKFEVRHALADWGKLPANPTLYLEWVEVSDGPDVAEVKLLLGDELRTGWHWGSNLVWEREVSGDLTNEYQLTLGLAHTLRDERLSLGAEMRAGLSDIHSDRGDFDKELELGPSLRWHPVPALHVDFAPLIGIGPDSRAADIFLVLGWEF